MLLHPGTVLSWEHWLISMTMNVDDYVCAFYDKNEPETGRWELDRCTTNKKFHCEIPKGLLILNFYLARNIGHTGNKSVKTCQELYNHIC